jgi:outer membrane receptor protein involved in Fe transport
VSLRGVGASGASRALVLADGVPLNDPFGGWIYWGRVPRAAVERVEVLRGAASDLYGSAALSGVIQVFRRPAGDPRLVVEASAGELGSADGSLYAGRRWGAWGASFAAEGATTGGYVPVAPDERGAVDVEADSRHTAFEGAAEREIGGLRLGLRASRFEEARDNGTGLQDNDTAIRSWSAGLDAGGSFSLRAWGGEQDGRCPQRPSPGWVLGGGGVSPSSRRTASSARSRIASASAGSLASCSA